MTVAMADVCYMLAIDGSMDGAPVIDGVCGSSPMSIHTFIM